MPSFDGNCSWSVRSFLDDHPGGKMAVMTFAGRDASEEFNMLHEKNVVEKYTGVHFIRPLSRPWRDSKGKSFPCVVRRYVKDCIKGVLVTKPKL